MVSRLPDESDQDYAALTAYAEYNPRPGLAGTGLAEVAFRNRWDERLRGAAALATVRARPMQERSAQMADNLIAAAEIEMQKLVDRIASMPAHDSALRPKETIALVETVFHYAQMLATMRQTASVEDRMPTNLTPDERSELRALTTRQREIYRAARSRT